MPPRDYPRGKLRADDQGSVEIRLVIQDGTLVMIFPHPTTWVGLGPDDLERWIHELQGRLAELRRRET